MVDINSAIAQLARNPWPAAGTSSRPGSFAPIVQADGQTVAAHIFQPGLLVVYALPDPSGKRFVTEDARTSAGLTDEALLSTGIANLARIGASVTFRRMGRALAVEGAGDHAASLVLIRSLWERDVIRAHFPNGPVAAIGALDTLVICDRNDADGITQLRRAAEFSATLDRQDRALTDRLFRRDPAAGIWIPVQGTPNSVDPWATTAHNLSATPPIETVAVPVVAATEPRVVAVPEPFEEAASDSVMPVAPNERLGEMPMSTAVVAPAGNSDGDGGTASPEREEDSPFPRWGPKVIATALVAMLCGVITLLSFVVDHVEKGWQIGVFGLATLWFGAWAHSLSREDTAPETDEPAEPTSALVFETGVYGVASVLSVVSAFAVWHRTDETTFSGIERGGGTYALVFGLILGLLVLPARHHSRLSTAWDAALRSVAAACGTVFVLASISGAGQTGLTIARFVVLIAGLIVIASATASLRWANPSEETSQLSRLLLIASGGFAMLATPFFSWGGGGFIVNYVPGIELGLSSGRLTAAAGALVLITTALFALGSYEEDFGAWKLYAHALAVLSLAGFYGVLSQGTSESHVGRSFAVVGCAAVLVLATGSQDRGPSSARIDTPWSRGLQRVLTGSFSLLAASSVAAAVVASNWSSVLSRLVSDHDDLLPWILLLSLGFVLAQLAFYSSLGRALPVTIGGVLFAALAILLFVNPTGGQSLAAAAIFGALALACFTWPSWQPPTRPHRSIATFCDQVSSNWKRVAVACIAAWVCNRYVLVHLVPSPGFPQGEMTLEDYEAAQLAIFEASAIRRSLFVGVIALLMAPRKRLPATAVAVLLGGLIATEMQFAVLTDLVSPGVEFRTAAAVIAMAAVGWFSLGRGPGALPALMLASLVQSTSQMTTVFLLGFVPRWDWLVPLTRELAWGYPDLVAILTWVLVFLFYPVRVGANNEVHDSEPNRNVPDAAQQSLEPARS